MSDILFRYFGTHGIETLRERSLMVSKISAFNDVFECAYRIAGEITEKSCVEWIRSRLDEAEFLDKIIAVKPELRVRKMARRDVKNNLRRWAQHFLNNKEAVIRALKEERETLMDRSMRVASFSSAEVAPLDEVLIWSHYSNKHAGLRIGFEFPNIPSEFALRQIVYRNQRAPFDLSLNPFGSHARNQMDAIMFTKSEAWSYENEFRMVTASERCRQQGSPPRDFLPFDPQWVKRVDFGVRFPQLQRDRALHELRGEYSHVRWFQARLHETDYALTYAPLNSC